MNCADHVLIICCGCREKMARLLTLQVTRGVAANLVVLSHLSVIESKYTGGQIIPAFSLYGTAGVDVFFVLSGLGSWL